MKIVSQKNTLSGSIQVPGSKSHTIRALLLACLAEGTSCIKNPLPSEDCISTAKAVPLLGSEINFADGKMWSVKGAGKNIHCPKKVDVGNSGSLLYFLSAICATLDGVTVFDGDASIRKRPVNHVVEALSQLGAVCHTDDSENKFCPLYVEGIKNVSSVTDNSGATDTSCAANISSVTDNSGATDTSCAANISSVTDNSGATDTSCAANISSAANNTFAKEVVPEKKYSVTTAGEISSQYITGIMLAATRLNGITEINLTNPKETPYLTMTQKCLEQVGVKCSVSDDYKKITVEGTVNIKSFDTTIPSDWEAVAFPLLAAFVTKSRITITDIDGSGTQGDDAIVEVLKQFGEEIEWNREEKTITTYATNISSANKTQSTSKELHINLSGYPDALCALAVAACFTEGTIVFEDLSVCRRKETDRITVMKEELCKTGAQVEEGEDVLVIHGHSPLLENGGKNPQFKLHGATIESRHDHRVAMAFACMGLGLPDGEKITVNNAECCSVSFPHFYEKMNSIGAGFTQS